MTKSVRMCLGFEDFEDIAVGPGPVAGIFYIYAGDIGDNGENRNTVSVYWVAEPEVSAIPTQNPPSRTLKDASQVKMKYPDGAHNAEALLCDPLTRDLYVVTKQSLHSRVYRLRQPDLQATKTVTLEFVLSGNSMTLADPADFSARFYRLRQE